MHSWLAAELDQLSRVRGAKLNVIGPRGGAKSTLATLAHVLRAALEEWEPYIWIVSDTRHQACGHLENVKLELVENERLAERYGQLAGRGPVWRASAIQLANQVRIEAFGVGQKVRGRRRRADRPSLIVCDDVQNDSHMESARAREHSRRWFQGTLLKAGNKRTNVVNLATALHRDALAIELSRTPGWTSRTFRAIERWPDDMALWQEWEAIYVNVEDADRRQRARAFYQERRPAMDQGVDLLWPEEEDLYTLMCMRVEGGKVAFEREKQGSPANPDLYEWPDSYFESGIWFDAWPSELRVRTIALDPSKGRDDRLGDYSAFALLGVDPAGLLYVEADLARRPTTQMVADGTEWVRTFRPDAFGIEANQYQELLGDQFAAEFRRQDLFSAAPWSIENRVNKQVRIRRLGPYLAQRRLRFKSHSPATALLVEQLREFPVGAHDDGPDALEMAIRLAGELCGPGSDDGLGSQLRLES
jgi:predicted phage terminase large subunit-like protein